MKFVDVTCPVCNNTRSMYYSNYVARKGDICRKCHCRKMSVDNGRILHGLRSHPLFNRWADMKFRCKDTRPLNRKSYLEKNITVCDEWKSTFLNFYNWSLQNGFSAELEIDRIDNDAGYSPSNCRWVTHKVNCENRGGVFKK